MHSKSPMTPANNQRLPLSLVFLVVLQIAGSQATPAQSVGSPALSASGAERESSVQLARDILTRARAAGGIIDLGGGESGADPIRPDGFNVGEALSRALTPGGKYSWRESDGVINVIPREGVPSLLYTKISSFEWLSNETPLSVVDRLQQCADFTRGTAQLGYENGLHSVVYPSKPPRVAGVGASPENVQVFSQERTTVFELLNAIVRSYNTGVVWRYSETRRGSTRVFNISAQ